jgi:molecular chaperone DnaJ
MAVRRDYYEVLGITRDADGKTIKAAYRKMAMQYHPDRNPGNPQAEEIFKDAAEAYEVLSDDNKRAIYDRAGHDGLKSGGFNPGFQGDLGDIFSHFGDIFAEFFGGGGGFGGRPRPMAGSDIRYDLEITLEEAKSGTTRTVEVQRTIPCEGCSGTGAKDAALTVCAVCGGRGQVVQGRGGFMIATTCRACAGRGQIPKEACTDCSGVGRTEETRKLEVRVPLGVENGMRLRIQGEGDGGANGGPPGSLFVFMSVAPHDMFVRNGGDLHCELAVGFAMACLGGTTMVPKLGGGEVEVAVPAGMQPGDVVRIAGEGLPQLHGRGGVGSLMVHLTIQVPKRLDDPQKKAVKDLDAVLPVKPEFSATGPDRRETNNKKRKAGGLFDRIRDALEGE